MDIAATGTVRVPGADLYYSIKGTGPLLLLLPGGGGDADCAARLTDELVAHRTVLTYDRRGQTRTRVDDGEPQPTIGQHAQDAFHLLTRFSAEPALVFGSSTGAVIGLELALRHPEQVRLLVAHEPPLLSLVPEAERAKVIEAAGDTHRLHREGGWQAVFKWMSTVLELPLNDVADPTAEAPWVPPTSRRESANLSYFIANDFGATWAYRPDDADWRSLRESSAVIVPAVSAHTTANGESFLSRTTAALAGAVRRDPVVMPGGHNGYLTHPTSFASALLGSLSGCVAP